MRLNIARCLLFLVLGCAATVAMAAPAQFDIIPKPQHLEAGQGAFKLVSGDGIAAPADARAQWIAGFLRDKIHQQTGVDLKVVDAPARARIRLRIDSSIQGKGAYRLQVTGSGVTLAAADDRGLFWGVQTLRQLLPLHADGAASIPAVRIQDAPRFSWRGVMLDVSRHFYPVDFIKKQIDLMSYYKFDVFHWHLTDDEGWRIQIRKYPKLTSVGAWRTGPDGKREGGFYTQKQIREVVAYARARNVMVVPEIEMPGHTSAAVAAYPELSCSGKPVEVPAVWGGFRNADCVAKASTYTFLENVLDEVMQLFPSPYIHIGGDEVPTGIWADCKACQKLAREHGLEGEEGLQGYFTNRIGRYIESKGRTMMGWDELLESGDLSKKAVVEAWRAADVQKAFASGNRVVLAAPYYLDWAVDIRTLQDLYRNNPFAGPLLKKHPELALGGEAPLWSERATPLNASARLYPRLLVVSEQLWNPDASPDWKGFQRRVTAQEAWLASQHVAYGPRNKNIVNYQVTHNTMYQRWRIRAARGFDDLRLHYTLDGSQPTVDSPSFTDVLDLYQPAKVTIAPFRGDVQYQASTTFDLVKNLALGARVRFDQRPMWPYMGDRGRLTNGILAHPLGSAHFRNGSWDGWLDSDMRATVVLKQAVPVHSIDVRFLAEPGNRILLPRTVSFLASTDGQDWKPLQTVLLHPDPNGTRTFVKHVRYKSKTPVTLRYLRVIATGYGGPVFGYKTWILTDQIILH